MKLISELCVVESADEFCDYPEENNINYGYILEIDFEDRDEKTYSIDVIVSDEKYSSDRGDFYPHNNIVEFIVDGVPKGNITENGKDGDNVSFDKLLGGKDVTVEKVYSYEDEVLVTGNYLEGWRLKGCDDAD